MTLKDFNFNVIHREDHARVGIIETHRGNINTPAFMPVGTQATIKGAFIKDVIETGSEIILSNTKKFIISPEESIRIQKGLNSDVVMVMDECPKKNRRL